MNTPQSGIFAEGRHAHYFLEYTLHPDTGIASLSAALQRANIAQHVISDEAPHVVIGFGSNAWDMIATAMNQNGAGLNPGRLRPFTPITGKTAVAPATQTDLLIWIHGPDDDVNFGLAMAIGEAMNEAADLVVDIPGFTYLDARDLTGFIDGTENPTGDDARRVALIPGDEAVSAGSFIMTQRWVHDLHNFGNLPQAEQEKVIGRTKPDSVQLRGDAMPPTSHVSRVDYKIDGKAVEIYRRSAPYGTVSEKGLLFIAFAAELEKFDLLLGRMFGTSDDEYYDRLVDFSKAVTGSYFFAPPMQLLEPLLAG